MIVPRVPTGCVLHGPEAATKLDANRDGDTCVHEGSGAHLASSGQLSPEQRTFELPIQTTNLIVPPDF